ncbi:MAG: ParA family protein [Spirochaetota bacterium]
MKIAALYNLKGGVGKTAAAVNLAALAARDGLRTLLLDLDPQGASSFYFRVRPSRKFNAEKFAKGKKLHKHIKETDYKNLDLLPADLSFRSLDIIFDDVKNPHKQLSKVMSQLSGDYDIVLIDAPASIGVESENVFHAADKLIIPLVPAVLSIESYNKVFEFYGLHGFDTSSILAFFSMVDARKKMHRETVEKYTAQGSRFLKSTIFYSSEIEQMGIYRAPIVEKHPYSRPSEAFTGLWNELKERIFVDQRTVFFTERKQMPTGERPCVQSSSNGGTEIPSTDNHNGEKGMM